uniref:Uncharacterized protein n=1 Tax=Arundo donax TaxID=35708 RepID=A0A0A9BYW2_ARUDO
MSWTACSYKWLIVSIEFFHMYIVMKFLLVQVDCMTASGLPDLSLS